MILRSLLLAAVVLAAGCDRGSAAKAAAFPIAEPLVVVGVDGLEWRLALELMQAGRMPALRALAHDGSFAKLQTLQPALSPPIWTSMATGLLPGRHGITGFVRTREGAAPELLGNRDRRAKALWNIAEDAGRGSCIVGYWATFPVEQSGVMVAQTGAAPGTRDHDHGGPQRKGSLKPGRSGQVHPPELEARVFALAARAAGEAKEREKLLYGDVASWPRAMQQLVEHSRWSLEADTAYESIALDLLSERGRCGLLVVYLGLPDVLGHRFWRWTYPSDFSSPPSGEEVARYGEVLRRAYEQVDRFVASLRRAAGGDATFVVVSDHGMGAFRPKAELDIDTHEGELLRTGGHSAERDALLVAAGPGIAKRPAELPLSSAELPRAGHILDVAPTLLALLGLPRGADMDGKVAKAVLDEGFLAAHPLRELPTHTPEGWMQSRRFAEAGDEDSARRLEQLRGLGYLE